MVGGVEHVESHLTGESRADCSLDRLGTRCRSRLFSWRMEPGSSTLITLDEGTRTGDRCAKAGCEQVQSDHGGAEAVRGGPCKGAGHHGSVGNKQRSATTGTSRLR